MVDPFNGVKINVQPTFSRTGFEKRSRLPPAPSEGRGGAGKGESHDIVSETSAHNLSAIAPQHAQNCSGVYRFRLVIGKSGDTATICALGRPERIGSLHNRPCKRYKTRKLNRFIPEYCAINSLLS